ncbi:MAG TPA: hypothetical protein PKW82_04845 [Spirochaetales bacterium]|nr:hypothetical protein [Spirochaetales bacterium]
MLTERPEAEASFPGFMARDPAPLAEEEPAADAEPVETRLAAWLSKVDR